MRRQLLFVILGGLLVLLVGLMILRTLVGNDETPIKVTQIVENNDGISRLSEIAVDKASTFQLQSAAINMNATAKSFVAQLSLFYEETYGGDVPEPDVLDTTNTDKLEAAQPGSDFDATFKSLAKSELEQDIVQLKSLQNTTSNETLRSIIVEMIDTHNLQLELL